VELVFIWRLNVVVEGREDPPHSIWKMVSINEKISFLEENQTSIPFIFISTNVSYYIHSFLWWYKFVNTLKERLTWEREHGFLQYFTKQKLKTDLDSNQELTMHYFKRATIEWLETWDDQRWQVKRQGTICCSPER